MTVEPINFGGHPAHPISISEQISHKDNDYTVSQSGLLIKNTLSGIRDFFSNVGNQKNKKQSILSPKISQTMDNDSSR